jgi:hypothetical protein
MVKDLLAPGSKSLQCSAMLCDPIQFWLIDCCGDVDQRDKEGMKIRADSQRGLWLPDATEAPVYSLMQVFAVLRAGAKNRKVAATSTSPTAAVSPLQCKPDDRIAVCVCAEMNEHSSRSHALLILTIQRRDNVAKTTKLSQLYLVDLYVQPCPRIDHSCPTSTHTPACCWAAASLRSVALEVRKCPKPMCPADSSLKPNSSTKVCWRWAKSFLRWQWPVKRKEKQPRLTFHTGTSRKQVSTDGFCFYVLTCSFVFGGS